MTVLHRQEKGLEARGPAVRARRGDDRDKPSHTPRHGFATASPRHGLAPSPRRPSNGLPERLRANIEAMSGLTMDDVRVHRNSSKPAKLHAHAFTQGPEIHVAPGQEQHLPHEAWHVVQQKQGRVPPTIQLFGVHVNDDSALEREADRFGSLAAAGSVPAAGRGMATATVQRRAAAGAVVQRAALSASSCTVYLGNDFRDNHLAESALDAKAVSVARARSLGVEDTNTVINSTADNFTTTVAATEFNNWVYGTGGRWYKDMDLDHWQVTVARGGNDDFVAGTTNQSTSAVTVGAYFNERGPANNRTYNVVVSKVTHG